MRVLKLKTSYRLFTLGLGFVLVSGFGIMLHAQDAANCTTTSRVETYHDSQGKVRFQKIEIKSAIPDRVIAMYSQTSTTPIPLTKFWALRRKAYLACAEYYEKIERQRAHEKGAAKSLTIPTIFGPPASSADGTGALENSALAVHDQ